MRISTIVSENVSQDRNKKWNEKHILHIKVIIYSASITSKGHNDALRQSILWASPLQTQNADEKRRQEGEGVCATINVWPAETDSLHLWLFFCTRKAAPAFSSTAPRRMPHPRLLLRGDIRKGLLGNGTKSAILLLPQHFYLMTKTSKSTRRKYARNVEHLKILRLLLT